MGRNIFQRIPFIRIFSLFIPGIVVGFFYHPATCLLPLILTVLLVVQLILWFSSKFVSLKIQNFLLPVILFLLGVFYANVNIRPERNNIDRKSYFWGKICQKPAEKARTYQTLLLLQNDELAFSEKVIAYFDKKNFDSTLTTGDRLIVIARLQPINNQGNPYEFNYQSMVHRRGIWYSVYLSRSCYLRIGKPVVDLSNWAEKFRDHLVEKLADVLHDKEERSVVSALTLGYRTELDQETLDYFASTGAMHVLSVSGLHVALLYMILGFLLGFLKRNKAGRTLFPIIMIFFLWFYAFISGFSPPVQRATVMFTFVIVGNELRRPVNIYNSLTASALLLILLDPNVVFDVGFQLSYLAIFGIVLIQPALFNLFELKNKILKWLWALFTVSIAAQLVTFPLGVYYFNQFPNFFWLSNFVVVPVTTVIMWATIVFFIVSPIQVLAGWTGLIIQKLTWVMLTSLKMLDAHPWAVTRGLVFSAAQLVFVFGIIFSLVIFFSEKRKTWLFAALIFSVLFWSETLFEKYKLLNKSYLLVYNSKSTIIHLINGRSNYVLVNDSLKESEQKMIQKVVDHCRLNYPVVINRTKTRNAGFSDLHIDSKSIDFLNLRLEFAKTLKNNTDEFSVTYFPEQNSNDQLTYFISTAYPRNDNPEKLVHYTRLAGSYQLVIR
jgi:competence protein ComEC